MTLQRYKILDEYTLKEFEHEFQGSDSKGRVKILQELYKDLEQLPYEIALMAVKDQNINVRNWIARNGQFLDYRDISETVGQKAQENNLENHLKNDSNPLVRASLHENPNVYGGILAVVKWDEYFHESSHLERLALVRNPDIYLKFTEKLFNHEDKELKISLKERKELCLAFLTNNIISESHKDFFEFVDGYSASLTKKEFKNIWELTTKWSDETGALIKFYVYSHIGTDDATKAETYQTSGTTIFKKQILEHCNYKDKETLTLGKKDSDGMCRYLAYTRIHLDSEEIEEIIKGKDTDALSGLSQNKSLSEDNLKRVADRLSELGYNVGAEVAGTGIERNHETSAPTDPDELFGLEGRQGNFLEDKVDFIGKKLIDLEEEIKNTPQVMVNEVKGISSNLKLLFAIVVFGLILFFFLR